MIERDTRLEQLAVNTIRTLSIDAVDKANSGHPGMPMGAAPMAYALWAYHLKHNPSNPNWFNRDRFVLSAGHGSMLLYSLLHLFGYGLTMDDLKNFRQWGSKTPGHPEYRHTAGVEATTGPLGQGISMAVGMAMAERHMAAVYNREGHEIIDHHTYTICGDGDLMEGVSSEAASLAGHLKLGRLIALYDSNEISLDGDLVHAFSEDVKKRFEAYGWHVLYVEDGNDVAAISRAITEAKEETERPTLIEVRTVIGFGSPKHAGKHTAHGSPLGADETKLVKEKYAWNHEPFTVPDEAAKLFAEARAEGGKAEEAWNRLFEDYLREFPELGKQLQDAMEGRLPAGWETKLPTFTVDDGKIATRDASGKVLNAIAEAVPAFWGGSADLASSNKTALKNEDHFRANNYAGRNIWFGVREHAMGATMNGISLHGGTKVYGATFFVFSDYLRPAIRLSALMQVPVIYVLTHDTIAVGEDGPTHQPVEHLPALRAIPGLNVFRPADANETAAVYRYALEDDRTPSVMVLSRQGLPVLPGTSERTFEKVSRGAYIVSEAEGNSAQVILLATGSEVGLAVAAQKQLAENGIAARVVSMPSWELFEKQPDTYKETILPSNIKARVAIEMAIPLGWDRYVGDDGIIIGINGFGASAPGDRVMKEYGFSVENVVDKVNQVLNK